VPDSPAINPLDLADKRIDYAWGGKIGIVVNRVPHRKIPFGQKFGGQMVAMGMLYYRLRDML